VVALAREHRLVVTVEDNGRVGGCGAALMLALSDAGCGRPVRTFGIPQEFLGQAKRAVILDEIGLSAQGLAREITASVAALEAEPAAARQERTPEGR
jgi:1-deoxy-D-xylulose-5-phosphate synthase